MNKLVDKHGFPRSATAARVALLLMGGITTRLATTKAYPDIGPRTVNRLFSAWESHGWLIRHVVSTRAGVRVLWYLTFPGSFTRSYREPCIALLESHGFHRTNDDYYLKSIKVRRKKA